MNVLAIGAHFDDVELGCGGAIARHVDAGDRVAILTVTHSGYVDTAGRPVRDRETALAEGRAAAAILGVQDLTCAGLETNNLVPGNELVRVVRSEIDRLSISTVYTHWTGDVHGDHRTLAQATLSATRHVPRLLMYRSNWYTGETAFDGTILVDISAQFDRKIAAITAHESEMKRAGGNWLEWVRNDNRNNGLVAGVEYAEAFNAVRYVV